MRVVLDTNVLIAAFVSRGRCAQLLEHCAEAHEVVTSAGLLQEYEEKLVRKFRLTPDLAAANAALLRSVMEVVDPPPLPNPVCRDPDDDLVIATARAGACACIVTGDNDLLVLRSYGTIDIISPAGFPAYEASRLG
ncbi:MAG: putative toxin-antitoxin system toxin component, PIN family [Gemmatimonadetes bacterium]|nr:putative toxin-antitoxin system toxin component, PIN family [Gemmatimonadota bacterium]